MISEQEVGITPKVALSYKFDPDMMVYADVAKGYRPGGGNALYPTTGIFWGPAYAPLHFCCGWPASYKPDDVWSYEAGEKARFFDRRLIVDASVYYENWMHPQLLAYPGDWAFNINGDKAEIVGSDVSIKAILGGGSNSMPLSAIRTITLIQEFIGRYSRPMSCLTFRSLTATSV